MTASRHRRHRLLTALVCLSLLLLLPGCGMFRQASAPQRSPALQPRSLAGGIGATDSLGQVVFIDRPHLGAPTGSGIVAVPVLDE